MPLPIVALVGAPNAGKSTLFNRLIGRRKALVHPEPGMTRDLNEEPCDWEGRGVILQDTGGLIVPGDPDLAAAVRRHVLEAARGADVLVLLLDGRAGVTPRDEEIARLIRRAGRPVVVAVNKIDVPAQEPAAAEFHRLGFAHLVPISAEHGLGIDDLLRAVSGHLPPPEAAPLTETPSEIRIAIAGRPNVGKSSLLNAILGRERTLVSEVPGTTRDAIDCLLTRGDRTYRIADTAGMRRRGRVTRRTEVLSVMAAGRAVRRADVVLIVIDATEEPTQQDLHVAGVAHEAHRPFIVLLNKWDLAEGPASDLPDRVRQRLRFAPHAPILTISARTGLRVSRILPLVEEVHTQASRRVPTGRLNSWLERAVAGHRPPGVRGRTLKLFYAAQTSVNPPTFVLFTNRAEPPHFSYRRYLENSLRESFALDLTPVEIEYRERPRRQGLSGGHRKNAGKRSV